MEPISTIERERVQVENGININITEEKEEEVICIIACNFLNKFLLRAAHDMVSFNKSHMPTVRQQVNNFCIQMYSIASKCM